MRLSYSMGSLLSIEDVMRCAPLLRERAPETVWIPETWGMEGFAMLGMLSQKLDSNLGTSIINVYSRSPALIGMGAATIDAISGGRMMLGLGASTEAIISGLHGIDYTRPLARMRQYIGIIRKVISGEPIEGRPGMGGFRLLLRPPRKNIPIYVAAVNPKMTGLACEIADGVIFYLRPRAELRKAAARVRRAGKRCACQIITAISEDGEQAMVRAKSTIAFYVSIGAIYREFLAANGFAQETARIYERYKQTGKYEASLVPDKMAGELAIYGTPEQCASALRRFASSGIDMPIIQFNPIGDAYESLRLLVSSIPGEL